MAIKLSKSENTYINQPGEGVLLKVTQVDDKSADFGKVIIMLENEKGEKINNNFTLKRNGEWNQGALNAFSFFARQALNDNPEQIEPIELLGCYVLADIVLNEGTSAKGETRLFANINKVYATLERFAESNDDVDPEEDEDWD